MYRQTELSSEFLLKHQYHKMSVESLQCSRWQLCLVSGTECDMMISLKSVASAVQERVDGSPVPRHREAYEM